MYDIGGEHLIGVGQAKVAARLDLQGIDLPAHVPRGHRASEPRQLAVRPGEGVTLVTPNTVELIHILGALFQPRQLAVWPEITTGLIAPRVDRKKTRSRPATLLG